MRSGILTLCLMVATAGTAAAQTRAVGKVTDEKREQYAKSMFEKPPAERVRWLGIAIGHRMYSEERALELATQVVAQEDIHADKAAHAQALLFLASCHQGMQNLPAANKATRQAQEIALELKDAQLLLDSTFQLSLQDRDSGELAKAILRLADVRPEFVKLKATRHELRCVSAMGSLAESAGSYESAASFYEQAYQLAKAEDDFETATRALNNLAIMLMENGKLDESLLAFQKALDLTTRPGNPVSSFTIKVGIADNQLRRGKATKALTDLAALLEQGGKTLAPGRVAVSREIMARTLLKLDRPEEAEREANAGLDLIAERQRTYYSLLLTKARALARVKRFDESLEIVDGVLANTDDKQPRMYLNAARARADVLAAHGSRDRDAYEALAHADEFQRQLRAQEATSQLAAASAMTNLANKTRRLEELEQQKLVAELKANTTQAQLVASQAQARYNRTAMYSVVALGLLGVFGAGWIAKLYWHRRLAEREREASRTLAAKTQEMNEQLESELEKKTSTLIAEIKSKTELEKELQQARQIEALGTLTTGVAHDFNNLMTVVLSSNEALKMTASDRLTEREILALDASTMAAKSGAGITRQLLAMARPRPNKPTLLDVGDFLPEIRGLLERTLGEAIVLEMADAIESVVYVDPDRLTTALINLCSNARDAMSDRGRVVVRVDLRQAGDVPALLAIESMHPAAEFVCVSVTDHGCGMSKGDALRSTEPLFTTKPEGKGTGLGLSVVRSFAQDAGGQLLIESEVDIGTTATIALPLSRLGANSPVAPDDIDLPVIDGLSIVIVDDRASVLASVSRSLVTLGCCTQTFTSASDAIAYLEQADERTDILLADIRMPGEMDGGELAEHVQAQYPEMGLLLMTGYTDRKNYDFPTLSKPFTTRELVQRIDDALRHRNLKTLEDSSIQT